ncbi:hypothetical protein THRCLA_21513 [Thraustotheca clavata]|uniref:CID domain-containing protein n=1 Tax=Thraustotheca clavata TaxID=74557 RepID=A0A1V9ZWB8_9STRA|nr:hypothetical protein THRCLA_21513 [Thraustotheca clavata]
MPSAFSSAAFAEKLGACNETAGSIQSLSSWILFHRASLPEMLDAWYNSFVSEPAAKKIVHLYVANDVMQTGLRKYGAAIPNACSHKVMLAVAHAMHPQRDPQVQDVVRKLIRVWKERRILPDPILSKMSDLSSQEARLAYEITSDDDPTMAAENRLSLHDEMLMNENIVLDDLPDAEDSVLTKETARKLQDLEAEVISTDLLSDRMFQLLSNINLFNKAKNNPAYDVDEDDVDGINWDQLEVSVFETQVEQSQQQVETYRHHLEKQAAERSDLISLFESFTNFSVLDDPTIYDISTRMDKELEDIQTLYALCVEAVAVQEKTKRAQHKEAAKLERRNSDRSTTSSIPDQADTPKTSRWDRKESAPPPTSYGYSFENAAAPAPTPVYHEYNQAPQHSYSVPPPAYSAPNSYSSSAPHSYSNHYPQMEAFQYMAPEVASGYRYSTTVAEASYQQNMPSDRYNRPRRGRSRDRSSSRRGHDGQGYRGKRKRSRSRSRERY